MFLDVGASPKKKRKNKKHPSRSIELKLGELNMDVQ